jgi:hypothetical protein
MAYLLLASFHPFFAYIDPGTGSLILQLLLGGIAGIWVILKLFGQRIMEFFGKKPKAGPPQQ